MQMHQNQAQKVAYLNEWFYYVKLESPIEWRHKN